MGLKIGDGKDALQPAPSGSFIRRHLSLPPRPERSREVEADFPEFKSATSVRPTGLSVLGRKRLPRKIGGQVEG
jgi:hypothetical protein